MTISGLCRTAPAKLLAVGAMITATASITAAGAAPAAAPAKLGVMTSSTSIRLSGTPTAGATAVTFSTRERSAGPELIRLEPGVTPAQFSHELDALRGPPDALQKYGTLVSGAGVARGHARTLVIDLAAGTYVVANTDGQNPMKFARTSFTVAPGDPVALPIAAATITLTDFRFAAPAVIHRGLVRIVNAGHQLHFVDAIRVPAGQRAGHVVKLLHEGKDAKVKLPSTSVLGLVSPATVNLAEIDLKPGTYVLACFYGSPGSHGMEHTMLGMERAVRVR